MSRSLNGSNVIRQEFVDEVGAVPRDERHPARFPLGVDNLEQLDELFASHRRADLDPDRVAQPAKELDVGSREAARAIPDPKEMTCFISIPSSKVSTSSNGSLPSEERSTYAEVQ